MNKILQVSCNGLTNGGVQQVIMNITRKLSDEFKFDILVFTENEEYYDKEFLSYGGKIFRIPNKKRKIKKFDIDLYIRSFRIILGTYKILKNNGPYKAIHCHNYFESALCLIAAKMAKVEIRIVHSHNDFSNVHYSKLRCVLQKIYKKILNILATDKIGCSKLAINYLFDNDKKAYVINNAIDLNKFYIKEVTPKNYDEVRLLHVGNFSEQKNQIFLLKISKELVRKKINFKMFMVGGETEYLDLVKKQIENEKLEEKVKILPANTDISQIMNNSDLFIFPSLYEGLGIVLIEAQATGLHCIVSKAIPDEADLGNIEYIDDFEITSWVSCIEKCIKERIERKSVDMKEYDINNIIKEYRKIYLKG